MLYENILRPILFSLDPETAHELTLKGLKRFGESIKRDEVNDSPQFKVQVAGIDFPNKIGLAAGMDKSCAAPLAWQGMGFGFIEIGTITRYEQQGNPKPRLLRIPEEKSLINRMGFNNPGAKEISKKLIELKQSNKLKIPLGINIGKSRVVDGRNKEAVIEDYLSSMQILQGYADYLTINVSSPNTPGLREWESPEQLRELLAPLKEKAEKPIFLKISPDMEESNLEAVLEAAICLNIEGLIATNTTVARKGAPTWAQTEMGGLSGELLKIQSIAVTKQIAERKPKKMALISVGGISTFEDVKQRLDLGADLVQIYTAFVYGGPEYINNLNRQFRDYLVQKENNFGRMAEREEQKEKEEANT